MWILKSGLVCLAAFLLPLNSFAYGPPPQMYAPIVGRWHIDLTLDGNQRQLDFETNGEGNYGLGTGSITIDFKDNGGYKFDATWWNIDPGRLRISSEVDFHDAPDNPNTFLNVVRDKKLRGTLILRVTTQPGAAFRGDARFLDENLELHRGTFTMTRTAGPEVKKRK